MTEKTTLTKLKDMNDTKKQLEVKIKNEIDIIFREEGCEDCLSNIEFYDDRVWINLFTSCLISTAVVSRLETYFCSTGNLSYSDGDGFIITFKW